MVYDADTFSRSIPLATSLTKSSTISDSHDAGDPNDPDTDTPAVQRFGIDIDDPLLGGYTPWVIACCEACLGKAPAPISNADSLRALEVVHAIYDSEATPPLSVPTA